MITTHYQKEQLERRLKHPDNISILEEILARKSAELECLQKARDDRKLGFGKKIKKKPELETIVREIKAEVDSFLGVSEINLPDTNFVKLRDDKFSLRMVSASYGLNAINLSLAGFSLATTNNNPSTGAMLFNFLLGAAGMYIHHSALQETTYQTIDQRIRLAKAPKESLVSLFAHEYTHYLQHQLLFSPEKIIFSQYRPFTEGHARGVQRNIGIIYQQREGNDAFIWENSNYDVSELKNVYRWLCRLAGKKVSSSLMSIKTTKDQANTFYLTIYKEPTPHALGNSLMLIHEAQYGNDIYRKMLHGEHTF